MTSTGIGRFVGEGRFTLDRLIAATRSEPQAMKELAKQRVARLHEARAAEQRRVADAQARS